MRGMSKLGKAEFITRPARHRLPRVWPRPQTRPSQYTRGHRLTHTHSSWWDTWPFVIQWIFMFHSFFPFLAWICHFFTWSEKTQHNGFEYLSKLDQEGGGFNFFASGASLSLSIFATVTIYLFRVASAQCSESVHLRCRARCPDISQWAPDSQVIAPNQYHPQHYS